MKLSKLTAYLSKRCARPDEEIDGSDHKANRKVLFECQTANLVKLIVEPRGNAADRLMH